MSAATHVVPNVATDHVGVVLAVAAYSQLFDLLIVTWICPPIHHHAIVASLRRFFPANVGQVLSISAEDNRLLLKTTWQRRQRDVIERWTDFAIVHHGYHRAGSVAPLSLWSVFDRNKSNVMPLGTEAEPADLIVNRTLDGIHDHSFFAGIQFRDIG